MFVRAAVVVAGLALVTACGAPRDAAPAQAPATSEAPVAVPSEAPEVSPTEVSTDAARPAPSTLPALPTRVPVTTRKPVVTRTPVDSNTIVGPFGWQTLRLGMTPAEAEALGVATPMPEGGDLCQVWPAVGASALERVIVHPVHGVFAIHPKEADWLRTPEGMRIGWTTAQVAAAYPDFDPAKADYAHGPTVSVPGNPDAVYRMQFESGVLARFLLERATDLCAT
ncbi:hypothetical protein ACFPM7_09245 [Actinokineospora guangxiensis]|uniref:Lipoprotein n=1 Tax=Actinokineospora guangxiensis TaxID=1490288 RepID=A0ABW0EIL7_9PSEU